MTDPDNLAKQPPVFAEPAVTAALEPNQSAGKLVRVLDDYLADLQAGKPADRETVLAAHPDLASQLEQCLAGIEFIHRAGRTAGEIPAQLGDFRIRREIGRGGMGVVYEAEQLSLHRIVALKILRFGAVADREALERFRNEAETVAKLHHTNIVPIFAVGNEHGVNFYAMQLIEGQSLADVIQRKAGGRKSEVTDRNVGVQPLGCRGTLEPEPQGMSELGVGSEVSEFSNRLKPELQRPSVGNIGEWGLQAAEALAHAHGRGVIHRDIKPSNLLLDNEGTLWLTDFGLAKRIDDVALTLTGAILGTPRYMSPEQATSTRQPVDHRTDIYSLGATLYELVTGQPVFAAETPHEVISQIITTEPRPPRQFDRSLPRDLETIVMKCLAKEPARRYQTARELADDLRAFIDGRPIAARRLSSVARATRWVKKHRRTAGTMAAVAATVAVLFVGGYLAWRTREESLLGHLNLTTSGPSLVAEVLDKDDRPVVPSFPVPSSQPVNLREGSYQVRLSSPGMLSQTYPLNVERGGGHYFDPRLEDRWLWPPMELKPDEKIEPVSFGERTDLLVFRQSTSSLRRLNGETGASVWPQDLVLDKNNLPAGVPLEQWQSLLQASYFNPWQSSWLADPVDLDGDGTPDLVFASRKKSALVAVSGAGGKVLWMFRGRAKPDDSKVDPSKLTPTGGENNDVPMIGRAVIGKVDGDDSPRVVGCFASPGEAFMTEGRATISAKDQTWLEAVSGKTGKSLWRYHLGKDVANAPYDRWGSALEAIPQPQIVRVGEKQVVVATAGTKFCGVDLATGKEAWTPLELGFTPDRRPQLFALAGKKEPAALFVSRPSGQATVKVTLTAISLADRRMVWQKSVDGVQKPQFQLNDIPFGREFEIENLGLNGKQAVVAAAWHMGAPFDVQSGWIRYDGRLDLTVFDPGADKPRWEHLLARFNSGIRPQLRWSVGPDLNGDGEREIFAAWSMASRSGNWDLIVAAFSGRDGSALWRWTLADIPQNSNDPQPALCWWHSSETGQPMLVVPVAHAPGGQPITYIFDSANGRLKHTLSGVSDPRTCDLNGDGLTDLLYTVAPQGFARLMAVRGEPPVALRWLDGRPRVAAQDFDGDGLDDLLVSDFGGPIYPDTAVSGRDGRTLWKIVRQMGNSSRPVSSAMPIGDLQGEGRSAVLAFAQHEPDPSTSTYNLLEVVARSGRDGHRLWPSNRGSQQVLLQNGSASGSSNGRSYAYPSIGMAKLDPRQPTDVLVSVPDSLDPSTPSGNTNYSQVWLNIVSGETGKLRWKAAFAHGQFGDNGRVYADEFQDLNGDGVADVVGWGLPANAQPGSAPLELKAFSGADGSSLWPQAPTISGPEYNNGYMNAPVVGRLDGNDTADIVFIRQKPYDSKLQGEPSEVVAIAGRTGLVKWTWSWLGPMAATAPLLVDFDGNRRHSVCLFITEILRKDTSVTYQPALVILDGAGKVRKRIVTKGNGGIGSQFYGNLTWWRSADLRGDGRQQLLFFDEGFLQALGGESVEPIWKWRLPAQEATLIDVLPADKTSPTTIALWAGKSLYGISGPTGKLRWRGAMPTVPPYSSSYDQHDRSIVRDSNGLGLPRLLIGDSLRLTWPTDDRGRYQPPRGEPIRYDPIPDAVSLRPLPWAGSESVLLVVKMVPWTFLWLVVPALLIRRAMKRNSWRLAFVPAFYQLGMTLALKFIPLDWVPFNRGEWVQWDPHVGVCLLSGLFLVVHAAWMVRRRLWALVDGSAVYAIAIALGWSQRVDPTNFQEHNFAFFHISVSDSLFYLIDMISGGLPLIAAAIFLVGWLRRGQWIRLGLFLITSLACAAIFAGIMIGKDGHSMNAEEEYAMDGWALILFYGIYGAGALTLLGWIGKRAFRWCRRLTARIVARLLPKRAA